jgi:fatty acid desaturase
MNSQGPQIWQIVATVAGLVAAYAALFAGIWAVVTHPLESHLKDILGRLGKIETKLEFHL